MKNSIKLCAVILLFTALSHLPALAQLKTSKFTSTASMVNLTAVSEPKAPIIKSSFDSKTNTNLITRYDKTIKVSYQIPALNALEWSTVRNRAAQIIDSRFEEYFYGDPSRREAINYLAFHDFEPLSSYAPLAVKIDFRFNKIRLYNAEEFAPSTNAPIVQTKIMTIKK